MAEDLTEIVMIAVSIRALFNLENEVYLDQGIKAFRTLQIDYKVELIQ